MEPLNAILSSHVAQDQDTTNKLLGAAFIVVDKNEILYSGSSGRSDFPADARPFSTDSFGWVASLTKLVTTTCIMHMVERGLVALDDDMRPLAPELARMQILRSFDADDKPILEDNDKPITLRQASSRARYELADPDLMKWHNATGRTVVNLDWNREGFNTPMKFAPGDAWYYGTALDWAALATEKITGQTLGAYAQEHIFDVLGMRDSSYRWAQVPHAADRTVTYSYREEDKALHPGTMYQPPKIHDVESGGAGLFTTAADYATFMRGFMQGRLLKAETVKAMFTPQLNDAQEASLNTICYLPGVHDGFGPEFPKGLKLNHGIGALMNLEDVPGKRRRGSLCWSGVCNSRWWMDLETGIAAVLVVNVLPFGDPVVKDLYNELELAVYKHLVK